MSPKLPYPQRPDLHIHHNRVRVDMGAKDQGGVWTRLFVKETGRCGVMTIVRMLWWLLWWW